MGPRVDDASSMTTVIQLLYTGDFNNVITSPIQALDILQICAELLFDEGMSYCEDYLLEHVSREMTTRVMDVAGKYPQLNRLKEKYVINIVTTWGLSLVRCEDLMRDGNLFSEDDLMDLLKSARERRHLRHICEVELAENDALGLRDINARCLSHALEHVHRLYHEQTPELSADEFKGVNSQLDWLCSQYSQYEYVDVGDGVMCDCCVIQAVGFCQITGGDSSGVV